ncbi:hypothetical protein ANO14919_089040 [Xylariales sp. No.14919]|nr:hypothetical protein ANO14919_089040 [Xylariales sp. No.14919]
MAYYQPIKSRDEDSERSLEEDSALVDRDIVSNYRLSWLSRIGILLGATLALILYSSLIIAVVLTVSSDNRRYGTRFLSSPVSDYITYEPRVMQQWEDLDPDAPVFFTGGPSKEIDQNWHNLLEYMNAGIPASLMEGLGRVEEGIRFPDGTYFASLMVFHHLHCLKNIYHALHPEYYGLDRMTQDEQVGWQDHIGKPDTSNDVADSMILVVNERFLAHCFHMLKEAVMCQGDPMLVTMKWSKDGARPIGNLTSPHECVNWDRLMEWVEPHSVDVFEDGVLVHPKLGPVFIDGKFAESSM